MKAVVAATSSSTNQAWLLQDATALITTTDGNEQVDPYSNLGRNVAYFVAIHSRSCTCSTCLRRGGSSRERFIKLIFQALVDHNFW